MIRKYKRKVDVIEAFQFTQEMYEKFLLIPKNPKENPIDVKFDFFQDSEFTWNWHTKQLNMYGYTVKVGDYIIKNSDKDYIVHTEEAFNKFFEPAE